MKIGGLNYTDLVNGDGACTSLFTQGCPHKCPGCHNPELWNYNDGKECSIEEIISEIFYALSTEGVDKNFSLLGGEPLCPNNINNSLEILKRVKEKYPNKKNYVWTGYTIEELKELYPDRTIFDHIDVLIDGPYIQEQRNITLPLRGSENQRILYKNIHF